MDLNKFTLTEQLNKNTVIFDNKFVLKKLQGFKEIEIQNKLNHKNILRITDYFLYKNTFFVVFPYIIPNMDFVLSDKKINEFVDCLVYLHSKNIIHFDIKPDNIVINESNDLILIDFGVSQYSDEIYHKRVGTLDYIAPEILLMQPTCKVKLSDKIDIWSFGITLYEYIFKDVPFYDDDETISAGLILWGALRFPYETKYNYIIKQCLVKNVDLRLDSTQLKEQLKTLKTYILIVDDSLFCLRILEQMLKQIVKNAHIIKCTNGKDGYETLCKTKFDIVLSDENMPVLNGSNMFEKYEKQFPKLQKQILYSSSTINIKNTNCFDRKFLFQNIEKLLKN